MVRLAAPATEAVEAAGATEAAVATVGAEVAAADEQALTMSAAPTARPASDVQRGLGRIVDLLVL
jgi:hypothetical protein